MEIKINNNNWKIEFITKEEMRTLTDSKYLLMGLTIEPLQEIYILDDQSNKDRTLRHELTHAWLYEYGHNQDEKKFEREDVCEIVASINDFINDSLKIIHSNIIDSSIDSCLCENDNGNLKILDSKEDKLVGMTD